MTQPNSNLQKKMCFYDPWLTKIFFQEVRSTFTFIARVVCFYFLLSFNEQYKLK